MRFEPNLSILFTELPLAERPAAAAAAGFDAAELWWPFDEPEPDPAVIDALVRAFTSAGLGLAGLNFYAGDMAGGARGVMACPGADAGFRDNIEVAVELAARLGCHTLNALYGRRASAEAPELSGDLAIENLTIATRAADRIGARVVVEALNAVDVPGYGLPTVTDTVEFLDRARHRSGAEAWLSFDVYHAAMAGERLDELIDRHAARIGHVQLADVPGRHEPGSGTLDFAGLLGQLDGAGYAGWVGLEYVPTMESAESLRQTLAALTPPTRRGA